MRRRSRLSRGFLASRNQTETSAILFWPGRDPTPVLEMGEHVGYRADCTERARVGDLLKMTRPPTLGGLGACCSAGLFIATNCPVLLPTPFSRGIGKPAPMGYSCDMVLSCRLSRRRAFSGAVHAKPKFHATTLLPFKRVIAPISMWEARESLQ
jgi:hypothetical protein